MRSNERQLQGAGHGQPRQHRLAASVAAVLLAVCAGSAYSQTASAAAGKGRQPGTVTNLPPVVGEGTTVQDLLRQDAEAARANAVAIAAKAETERAGREKDGAPVVVAAPAAAVARTLRAEPVEMELPPLIVIEAITGTVSSESDLRVVDLTINGRMGLMRPGDELMGYRLMRIQGRCATFMSDAAIAKAERANATGGGNVDGAAKKKRSAAGAGKAAAPAAREVCISEAMATPSTINAVTLPGGMPLPNPVYRPALIPGQPAFPLPGTTSTGVPGR